MIYLYDGSSDYFTSMEHSCLKYWLWIYWSSVFQIKTQWYITQNGSMKQGSVGIGVYGLSFR